MKDNFREAVWLIKNSPAIALVSLILLSVLHGSPAGVVVGGWLLTPISLHQMKINPGFLPGFMGLVLPAAALMGSFAGGGMGLAICLMAMALCYGTSVATLRLARVKG